MGTLSPMASAGARAYNWGLGKSPLQRGPGAELLVRGSGTKPLEAERLLAFEHPMEAANISYSLTALRVQIFTRML